MDGNREGYLGIFEGNAPGKFRWLAILVSSEEGSEAFKHKGDHGPRDDHIEPLPYPLLLPGTVKKQSQ